MQMLMMMMTMMMEQDGASPPPEMMQMMKMMMGSRIGGTGNWTCESCGSQQAASVQSCQMCGLPKVQEVFDQGFGNAGAGKFVGTSADMLVCSVHGKRRTRRNLMDDGMGGMCCMPGFECGGDRNAIPFAAGDWECPGCGDHQFAKNQVCRKCSYPKPERSAPMNLPY